MVRGIKKSVKLESKTTDASQSPTSTKKRKEIPEKVLMALVKSVKTLPDPDNFQSEIFYLFTKYKLSDPAPSCLAGSESTMDRCHRPCVGCRLRGRPCQHCHYDHGVVGATQELHQQGLSDHVRRNQLALTFLKRFESVER